MQNSRLVIWCRTVGVLYTNLFMNIFQFCPQLSAMQNEAAIMLSVKWKETNVKQDWGAKVCTTLNTSLLVDSHDGVDIAYSWKNQSCESQN